MQFLSFSPTPRRAGGGGESMGGGGSPPFLDGSPCGGAHAHARGTPPTAARTASTAGLSYSTRGMQAAGPSLPAAAHGTVVVPRSIAETLAQLERRSQCPPKGPVGTAAAAAASSTSSPDVRRGGEDTAAVAATTSGWGGAVRSCQWSCDAIGPAVLQPHGAAPLQTAAVEREGALRQQVTQFQAAAEAAEHEWRLQRRLHAAMAVRALLEAEAHDRAAMEAAAEDASDTIRRLAGHLIRLLTHELAPARTKAAELSQRLADVTRLADSLSEQRRDRESELTRLQAQLVESDSDRVRAAQAHAQQAREKDMQLQALQQQVAASEASVAEQAALLRDVQGVLAALQATHTTIQQEHEELSAQQRPHSHPPQRRDGKEEEDEDGRGQRRRRLTAGPRGDSRPPERFQSRRSGPTSHKDETFRDVNEHEAEERGGGKKRSVYNKDADAADQLRAELQRLREELQAQSEVTAALRERAEGDRVQVLEWRRRCDELAAEAAAKSRELSTLSTSVHDSAALAREVGRLQGQLAARQQQTHQTHTSRHSNTRSASCRSTDALSRSASLGVVGTRGGGCNSAQRTHSREADDVLLSDEVDGEDDSLPHGVRRPLLPSYMPQRHHQSHSNPASQPPSSLASEDDAVDSSNLSLLLQDTPPERRRRQSQSHRRGSGGQGGSTGGQQNTTTTAAGRPSMSVERRSQPLRQRKVNDPNPAMPLLVDVTARRGVAANSHNGQENARHEDPMTSKLDSRRNNAHHQQR